MRGAGVHFAPSGGLGSEMLQTLESGTGITNVIALPAGAHWGTLGISATRVTCDDAPSISIQRTNTCVPLGSPSAK
jgi:tetrahydromethanopterin S-methyltransferase subunit D